MSRYEQRARPWCARRVCFSGLVLLAMTSLWLNRQGVRRDVTASTSNSASFTDYRSESPGRRHHIDLHDLPPPYATPSADEPARPVRRPANAWPQAPQGFSVAIYASGLAQPRLMRSAPNSDVFVAESEDGAIRLLRGIDAAGRAAHTEIFARGLNKPFGIGFYPPGSQPEWIYVADTDAVLRFYYRSGDTRARGPAQKVCALPGGGRLRGGGHWTRDIAFSSDGKTMYVSVGSHSNDDDSAAERNRADILQFNPDGSGQKVFAWGIRNAVGIAVHPANGELWASVNERDDLGDNLVPDYITHVEPGGFYGWPWWYIGPTQDPRHKGSHPELKPRVITPDVLLQPHNASLEMMFYQDPPGAGQERQFPAGYGGDIFAAEHGSWNRAVRTGYEVIRIPMHGGTRAENSYEDFLTGFVTADGGVWGRPVGVAEAADGSLLVSDDLGGVIWRVSAAGGNAH